MRLREYISKLEAAGELQRITARVDCRFEMAEIADRVSKMEGGGKALLFENVRGSKYPVLMNMMGSDRRMAMALGVDNLDEISKRIDNLLKGASGQAVENMNLICGFDEAEGLHLKPSAF